MKWLATVLQWYAKPWQRLDTWKQRRFPNVRSAWIRQRRLELCRYPPAGSGNGEQWVMTDAREQATDEWRIVQHRSRIGLRHRLNVAADWSLVAGFYAGMASPLLALAWWALSHVSVTWTP